MAIDPHAEAALALHRFGMGPRAGSIAAIASDPRGALLAELDARAPATSAEAGLMTSAQAVARRVRIPRQSGGEQPRLPPKRKARRAPAHGMTRCRRECAARGAAARQAEATPRCTAADFPAAKPKRALDAAFDAEIGFAERLVWFWSNHFCISADKVPWSHGRRLRARGDPAARARPLRRHAAGRRRPSGDAVLSRQRAPRSAATRSPASTAAAGSTRISRARSWSCIRSACAPATPRTTSPASPRC